MSSPRLPSITSSVINQGPGKPPCLGRERWKGLEIYVQMSVEATLMVSNDTMTSFRINHQVCFYV